MIGRSESSDAESFERAWTTRSAARTRARRSQSTDTAALVRTAELLTRSASIEPDEQFTADLRARLMTEAADVLVAAPAPSRAGARVSPDTVRTDRVRTHSPRRRRLAGLAAALVAGTATVGLVSSSASAVPGDVLYPVKRGVESVQLAVHRDDVGRGQTQLDQASERLLEAWTLDSTGRDDRVADALADFSEQATAGSTALFQAYDNEGDAGRIDAVTTFATGSSETIENMSDDLPTDARTALDEATETVLDLAERAGALCTSCAAVDLGSLVTAVEDEVDRAPKPSTDEAAGDSSSGDGSDPAPQQTQQPAKPAAPAPTAAPSRGTTPTPKPSTSPPRLRDLTDPVVGGLLGNDEQRGLVPSLLDGLLGGGKR